MKVRLIFLLAIFAGSMISGCESDPRSINHQNGTSKTAITLDSKSYQDAVYNRPGGNGASFTISKVSRDGNILQVDVTYQGGCKIHTFNLKWDGIALFTDPPTIPLILTHRANGDECTEKINETLYFDISKLTSNQDLLNKAVIVVQNGTSMEEKAEENETVNVSSNPF
jgi:hypothetical protein